MNRDNMQKLYEFLLREEIPFVWDMTTANTDCGCIMTAAHHCFGLKPMALDVVDFDEIRRVLGFDRGTADALFYALTPLAGQAPDLDDYQFYTRSNAARAVFILMQRPSCSPWSVLAEELQYD